MRPPPAVLQMFHSPIIQGVEGVISWEGRFWHAPTWESPDLPFGQALAVWAAAAGTAGAFVPQELLELARLWRKYYGQRSPTDKEFWRVVREAIRRADWCNDHMGPRGPAPRLPTCATGPYGGLVWRTSVLTMLHPTQPGELPLEEGDRLWEITWTVEIFGAHEVRTTAAESCLAALRAEEGLTMGEGRSAKDLEPLAEKIVTAYLETLMWSTSLAEEITHEGDTYREGTRCDEIGDVSDLPKEIVQEAREALEGWRGEVYEDTGVDPFAEGAFDGREPGDVAQNVLLTQNRHGTGFWALKWTHAGSETAEVRWTTMDGEIQIRRAPWADYLTERAHELGTLGLDVWVNESTGKLRYATHG